MPPLQTHDATTVFAAPGTRGNSRKTRKGGTGQLRKKHPGRETDRPPGADPAEQPAAMNFQSRHRRHNLRIPPQLAVELHPFLVQLAPELRDAGGGNPEDPGHASRRLSLGQLQGDPPVPGR